MDRKHSTWKELCAVRRDGLFHHLSGLWTSFPASVARWPLTEESPSLPVGSPGRALAHSRLLVLGSRRNGSDPRSTQLPLLLEKWVGVFCFPLPPSFLSLLPPHAWCSQGLPPTPCSEFLSPVAAVVRPVSWLVLPPHCGGMNFRKR